MLAKLVESPFYATGGGQVHDGGVIECEDGGCSRAASWTSSGWATIRRWCSSR